MLSEERENRDVARMCTRGCCFQQYENGDRFILLDQIWFICWRIPPDTFVPNDTENWISKGSRECWRRQQYIRIRRFWVMVRRRFGILARPIIWVQTKFTEKFKGMEGRDSKEFEGTGLNVRRYEVRQYVMNRQFRACFILYRVPVLQFCCYLWFIVFLWRVISLSADSVSCTFVCYLKVSCRRLVTVDLWRSFHAQCIDTLWSVSVPNYSV